MALSPGISFRRSSYLFGQVPDYRKIVSFREKKKKKALGLKWLMNSIGKTEILVLFSPVVPAWRTGTQESRRGSALRACGPIVQYWFLLPGWVTLGKGCNISWLASPSEKEKSQCLPAPLPWWSRGSMLIPSSNRVLKPVKFYRHVIWPRPLIQNQITLKGVTGLKINVSWPPGYYLWPHA